MTQIAATDQAIVRLLDTCGFPGVTVFSGPRAWDNGYLQRLLVATPAIVVAFIGAEPYGEKTSNVLELEGKWGVYICTGWNGMGQEERRIGAGAGLDLLHRAASVLHTAILMDERGERLPIAQVEGIGVETDASLDISNLWVASIAVSVELPLELLETESCYGPLDDFIKVRATFDLEGGKPTPDIADAGTLGDLPVRVDLPQT